MTSLDGIDLQWHGSAATAAVSRLADRRHDAEAAVHECESLAAKVDALANTLQQRQQALVALIDDAKKAGESAISEAKKDAKLVGDAAEAGARATARAIEDGAHELGSWASRTVHSWWN